MKVYVTYDPLYERIVCVHPEPNKNCPLCDPIWIERKKKGGNRYQLEENEYEVSTNLFDIS